LSDGLGPFTPAWSDKCCISDACSLVRKQSPKVVIDSLDDGQL
jgi:hypothetical protein